MTGLDERNTTLRELMDDPACDPRRLRATYRRFAIVNGIVGAWGSLYRERIRPQLRRTKGRARVLDLGCGGGDVIVRLARWAERDGLDVEWVGADPDARAMSAAAEQPPSTVRFVTAGSADLRVTGEVFDVVLSNHVLHHLDARELSAFADDSVALSSGIVLHADIARGRLAYGLYAAGILPLAPGTFLRTDGLRSIRRSYRPAELAAALGPSWTVASPAPFRLIAEAAGRA